ncbi:predicted protein [Naegleria gruberi]|uniref:Superoxide dismutase n=1 Tax=Naegleria gruberi TaxID=5762 RepID=D2W137_NAEGR|nr:uncharacterized protein NAEGRDRAFT_81995 [Naegleria gruberi]XP_002670042.1 uncharacterized protein NAEGRDRAFT_75082 [Naegleria gruberi]EFC37244.1 predicted protein [Naegleria gruberi]EFC37298.1 predicted protein [Naegleria gruberi]|eukprot:XP_002669988.1 predicted protein [Naegleria gruberi strain NEG-M]
MFTKTLRSGLITKKNIIGFATQQVRSKHQLPTLDYAVEQGIHPVITARQLDFHYNKHHKTYVDKLNALVEGTSFESQPLDAIIQKVAYDSDPKSVAIFNNAAQHFNHSFYWKSLVPGGDKIENYPLIKQEIEKQFGSVDAFKQQFTEKATTLFGSGWTWLVLDGTSLRIWNGSNAQTPIAENLIPLLTCDVWEHAYYLDHQNRRPDYLKTFWEAVNWGFVNKSLQFAVEQSSIKL